MNLLTDEVQVETQAINTDTNSNTDMGYKDMDVCTRVQNKIHQSIK